jgi:hypothetical protein
MPLPQKQISSQRRQEIIQEIVGILAQIHDGPVDKAALERAVRKAADRLKVVSSDFFDRRAIRLVRDKARKLDQSISALEKQIRRAPPELRARIEFDFRKPDFLSSLDDLSKVCRAAVEHAPKTDKVKEWCARKAFELVFQCTGSMPTSGSAKSPFRETTSLFYTFLVGERLDRRGNLLNWDLKRACDAVLAPWHEIERKRKAS